MIPVVIAKTNKLKITCIITVLARNPLDMVANENVRFSICVEVFNVDLVIYETITITNRHKIKITRQ